MKKYRKEIIMLALFAMACVSLFVFGEGTFVIVRDETADKLVHETLARFLAFAFLLPVLPLCGYGKVLRSGSRPRAYLWCLPCLFVAVCNFPFYAVISGGAVIERVDLIWLFALDCLCVGLMEEVLFRGLLQSLFFDIFRNRGAIIPVAVNSALFGLWHLTNLFGGGAIGPTLLQAGYSFLIGAMLSAVLLRTGNIWTGVFLHALFNFGGLIVPTLGSGAFQDATFWVLTAVFGIICLAHVLLWLLKMDKQLKKQKQDGGEEVNSESDA